MGAEGERKADGPRRPRNEEVLVLDAGPTEGPGWRMAEGRATMRWLQTVVAEGRGERAHTDPPPPPGMVCLLTWGGDSEG